jgi:hypothetical protein
LSLGGRIAGCHLGRLRLARLRWRLGSFLLALNPWGLSWILRGLIRIRRGVAHCLIPCGVTRRLIWCVVTRRSILSGCLIWFGDRCSRALAGRYVIRLGVA